MFASLLIVISLVFLTLHANNNPNWGMCGFGLLGVLFLNRCLWGTGFFSGLFHKLK